MKDYKTILVMNPAVGTGVQNVIEVTDWQHLILSVVNSVGSCTVKFYGSVAESKPDFETAASDTNIYEGLAMIDLQPSSSALVAGDTGIDLGGGAGKEVRMLKVQYPGIRWLAVSVTSYTNGSVYVTLGASNNK